MYLHKLFHQKDTLANQILMQQKSLQSNHFTKEIQSLLQKYQLENYEKEISKLSKYQWKKLIAKAVHEKDQEKIKNWCMNSSKCKNLISNEKPSE